MIEGIAASRSTRYATGRASRAGAYWVMNKAMPTAIGMAISMASSEIRTVVHNRSTMPKRRSDPLTTQTRENRKLALSLAMDGMASFSRNSAIRPMSAMVNSPAPVAIALSTRSPMRILLLGVPRALEPAPETGGSSDRVEIAVGCSDPTTNAGLRTSPPGRSPVRPLPSVGATAGSPADGSREATPGGTSRLTTGARRGHGVSFLHRVRSTCRKRSSYVRDRTTATRCDRPSRRRRVTPRRASSVVAV